MSAVLPSLRPLTASEQALVDTNLGLIRFTINRRCLTMLSNAYDSDDAWQDGYIGLCRAIVGYDPAKGAVSTHACQWIYAAVQRGSAIVGGRSFRGGYGGGPEASIDEVGLDERTIADTLVADAPDPAERLQVEHLQRTLASLCRDTADRAAATWMLGDEADSVVAARFDIARSTLVYRAKGLRRLLRRLIAQEQAA